MMLLMLKLTSWFHSLFRAIITIDVFDTSGDVPDLILHLKQKLTLYG